MNPTSALSVNQRKQQGAALLQAGRVDEAKRIFEELSRDAGRRDPYVWHLLSACHGMQGDYAQCETFARKAIELMPSFAGAWSNLGTALHALGRLAEAETALRRAIKGAPADAAAHSNLGSVYRDMKKPVEAEKCYREALRLQPNFADALTNLGLVMQDRGELTEAVALHRRALALNPQHADANYNLGYALMLLDDEKSATPCLERATQLNPNSARAWATLGSACSRAHDRKRAVSCYERAVSLDPQNAENLFALGTCCLSAGERDKAVAALTRAKELNPDHGETRYWLAAAGVGEMPDRMAAESIGKLFDGYAGNFDAHLVGALKYNIPAEISAILRRLDGPEKRPLTVLDLGCGTGLLGVEIRDITGHLAGVDLSSKMIEQARRRGIYDELSVKEIVACMEETAQHYDAVLAADVLIYLGDLNRVFAGAARILPSAGLFIFSVESHPGTEPYHLRQTGRFAHSLPYLRELSNRHGFEEISVDNTTIRMDNGLPIEGYVVTLKRR